jgi:fido (protein-threonine AMPylation protein)
MHNFDEYIRQVEPGKKEKGQIWQTAIGLQQVDGLKPSAYLIQTAIQNIEGDITFEEVKSRIDAYYKAQTTRNNDDDDDDRTEEADKVSARIAEILSEKTFLFSPDEYQNIHRRLFVGIYKFAGKIRDYNITKGEWVLDGDTVLYAPAETLKTALKYDIEQERRFDFKGLSQQQIIEHLANFTAYLWQIHPFGEGNTRTTAVFLIKYLHKLGYKDISNELFAQNSWFFRNALVRANYKSLKNNIVATNEYVVKFLENLILGENNILKNRELHINFIPNVDTPNKEIQDVGVKEENGTVNGEMFPVKGKKFLVNGEVFPVIGLEIMKLMEENPHITIVELSKQLHISDRAVKNNINKLRAAGIISRVGSDKTGYWKINN